MNFVRSAILLSLLVPTLSFSQHKSYESALKAYSRKLHRETLNKLKDPLSRESILLKSEELYDRNEFDKVVTLLKDLNDLDADYRVMLSTSLYLTYQFEDAKKVFQSLLDEEEEKDIVYYNLSATYYHMEIADSAIYYAKKALELDPNSGQYQFALGAGYSLNDETDKACGQFFLASKLFYNDAAEWYETENCESWKGQWLSRLSGDDRISIKNTMFPLIKDNVIATHRTYLFEEFGREQQLKLIELKELPVGFFFKFISNNGITIVRWSDKENKDWTLKAVKRFDEISASH